MTTQFSNPPEDKTSKYFAGEDNRSRRLMEMYRRFKSLQSQRFHLRNQLVAVEKYLDSLDSQIKCYESYEQLSLGK